MKMLENLDHEALLDLGGNEYDACVSLYMPVVRTGAETRQNLVQFRHLCQIAEQKLERYAVDKRLKEDLLEGLRPLEDNAALWAQRTDGLALFAARDTVQAYHAPVAFSPQAVVDKRFYIRPLLPLLRRSGKLDLVLLNQEGARLLTCTAAACEETLPPRHLRTLQNYLAMHEFEKSLQFRSNASPAAHTTGGAHAPSYHGQGTAGDGAVANRYLEDYYRHFKNWLAEGGKLSQRLYVVADAHNAGIFTKVAEGWAVELVPLLRKNIKDVDDRELADAVRAELEYGHAREGNAEYGQLQKAEEGEEKTHTVRSPLQIVAAAHEKRIKTLFLPESDNQLWGWFDPQKHQAVLEERPEEAVGEELLNLAAIRTLQTGGTVIVGSGDRNESAALCRW